jgi:hypothetical protein
MATTLVSLEQITEAIQAGLFAAEGNGLTTDEAQRVAAMINNFAGQRGFAPWQVINSLRAHGADERSIQQVQQWL